MIIRDEQPGDIDAVWNVNAAVFETPVEANLVNALRNSGCEYVSLVAEDDTGIVGHILFTPVHLTDCQHDIKIMGLAPMAVMSDHQKQGIGSQLVRAGLERCRSLGYVAVVVLGHPDYYPRFGFIPSVNFAIRSEYEVPDDVFMVLELVPGALENHKGVIKYHEEFNNL